MRKETAKNRCLFAGSFTLLLALAFLVGSAIAVTASNHSDLSESAREYFTFPKEVVTTGTVGVKTPIARITPSEEAAKNYVYGVFLGDNPIDICAEYAFLPEKAGDYTVRYHYLESGKAYSYSYVITVTAADGPVFDSSPYFPNAFIAGKTYMLPTLSAADWSSGEKKVADVTATVTCGETSVPVVNGTFVPVMEGQYTDAEIVYTAQVDGKVKKLAESIPVLSVYGDDGEIDMTGLFATRGFDEVKATDSYISFRSFGDAEVKYANLLGSNEMTIDFGFGAERYKAESLVVTVESYFDPSVAISIAFEKGRKESGMGLIRLNGGTTVKSYEFSANEKLTVTIDEKRSRITGAENALLFNLTEDINGAAFSGFSGGLVKVTIAVQGSYGSSELWVYKINNQNINNSTVDQVLPTVTFPSISREYTVGDTITIPAVYVIDVIDPGATLSASVRQNGAILTDVNGITLSSISVSAPLVFKAESSGIITVQYIVSDAGGNSYAYPLILNVYDRTPPALTVNGTVETTARLNSTVTLPGASATDNDGGEGITMQLIVISPSAYVKQLFSSTGTGLIEGTTFTFGSEGEYKIWYVATDEYGNYVRQDFIVKVEA